MVTGWAGATPTVASLPVLPDNCDSSRQQATARCGGGGADGSELPRRLIDCPEICHRAAASESLGEERRAKDVIYSPFRAPVFIGE